MFSFLFIAGLFGGIQVKAEVINSTLQSDGKDTPGPSVLISEQKDYSLPINKSFEDKGIKIEIKDITASKNEMKVKALIHRNGTLNEIYHGNSIVSLVVQNAQQNDGYQMDSKKIDNETVEYTFTMYNFKGFENSVDLRFDVILPEYDFNGWVKTTVDISKYLDLAMEKSLNFKMENYEFYKLESNAIGTNLFYKENNDNNVDEHAYGLSKVLIKYKERIYCIEDGYINHFDGIEKCSVGAMSTNIIKIDDLKDVSDCIIIPIECDLYEGELDGFYKTTDQQEPSYEIKDNVKYENKFEFADKSKVSIDKIERTDDKVKVYYNADSEKIAI